MPSSNRRLLLLGLSLLSGCAASPASSPIQPARAAASSPFGAYLIGRFAQRNNNPAIAADNLNQALAANPQDRVLLAQAFMASLLGGRRDALTLARGLPDFPLAQLLLGDTAAQHGDWGAAQAYFAGLTAPGLPQLIGPLLVAWAQQGGADVHGALATLRPNMGKQPLTGLYALHAAMIADLGDRYPEAQPLYATALANYGGTNLRLARILANWQYRQGHPDDAAETIRALGHASPALQIVVPGLIAQLSTRPVRTATDGMAEVYLSFAAELRQQNGAETALALLRLALTLRPDFSAARLLLADTLAAANNNTAALQALSATRADDPLTPLIQLRQALLQADLGQISAAETQLRQLARAMPDRPEPLAALADLQRAHHQPQAAIATYGQAIARVPAGVPDAWSLLFARAVTEHDSNDWPHAQNDLQQALALSPDQPEVLNFLGYAWADRNEHLTEARAMLNRAASLRPNDGAIIDSLGWVMLRQGDVTGAVMSLEKAAQMEPEDPEINGHLGDAYWAAGRKLQARYQWQLALNFNPPPDVIPRLRAKLQDATRATR